MLEFLLGLSGIFTFFGVDSLVEEKKNADKERPPLTKEDGRTFLERQQQGETRSHPVEKKKKKKKKN